MKRLFALLLMVLASCTHAPVERKVYLYGEINKQNTEIFLHNFKHQVNRSEPGDTITIIINSPGGLNHQGKRIIQAIKTAQHQGIKINTVCKSICASFAAVILEFQDI